MSEDDLQWVCRFTARALEIDDRLDGTDSDDDALDLVCDPVWRTLQPEAAAALYYK